MKSPDSPPETVIDYKNVFYPPGGILIWILILVELLTFGIALVFFVLQSHQEPGLFREMVGKLNAILGSFNTLVLLSSGYFMAGSVHDFKAGNFGQSKRKLLYTLLLGAAFVVVKIIEYSGKMASGLVLGANTFMDFYWLLTGFHLVHVLVGMSILAWMYRSLARNPAGIDVLDYEASAAFWHLCDLIWLLIFPMLYLLFLNS